jgi:cell division protein FtsA
VSTQPLVALDLGSTKVACAIGMPHERSSGFELVGTSLVPYPTLGEAWPGDLLMVSRTIEQALEATGVSGDFHRALVAVSHPSLVSERVRAAVALGDEPVPVRAQDLTRLQTAALDQVLGVDREPLLVERLGCSGNGFDGVRDPRGLTATRLTGAFHVVTMPVALRRAIVQAVESAGLEIARLGSTLPAALAGAADERALKQRVLVIDVGGLSTDVGLFVEGVLQGSGVVPWGGLRLAAAVARDFQVTMEQSLTWSLEGTACRKAGVRTLVTDQWRALGEAIHALCADQPKPDAAVMTGRGALIDGFAEWVEQATAMATVLGRSERLSRMADLSRQVGVSHAVGLLELATRGIDSASHRSPRLFNRLIDQTRTILTEYF